MQFTIYGKTFVLIKALLFVFKRIIFTIFMKFSNFLENIHFLRFFLPKYPNNNRNTEDLLVFFSHLQFSFISKLRIFGDLLIPFNFFHFDGFEWKFKSMAIVQFFINARSTLMLIRSLLNDVIVFLTTPKTVINLTKHTTVCAHFIPNNNISFQFDSIWLGNRRSVKRAKWAFYGFYGFFTMEFWWCFFNFWSVDSFYLEFWNVVVVKIPCSWRCISSPYSTK